ncbi:hypothetical protein Pcinc_042141 [Petrolisthes cinctipes]|uniref:Uncharacterized protein n=1 Tax=Petrolisthes cinctipes TaxID=88211 RepID=A0AAE1BIH7_PETCI|nr:hypothetical protein Pcinc_042141 [Petrolisthes cinctipes]
MDEQEMDLAEWFREIPIFYDEGWRDYKDTVKAVMYDTKDKSMYPPVAGSAVSRRRVGRAHQSTQRERDLSILITFAFVKGDIVRQSGWESSQCGVAARSSVPVTSEEEPDEMPPGPRPLLMGRRHPGTS